MKRTLFLNITIGIIAASLLVIAFTSSYLFYDVITLTPERAEAHYRVYGQVYENLETEEIVVMGSVVIFAVSIFLFGISAFIRTKIENEKLRRESFSFNEHRLK